MTRHALQQSGIPLLTRECPDCLLLREGRVVTHALREGVQPMRKPDLLHPGLRF